MDGVVQSGLFLDLSPESNVFEGLFDFRVFTFSERVHIETKSPLEQLGVLRNDGDTLSQLF